jgi:hypothetical protein
MFSIMMFWCQRPAPESEPLAEILDILKLKLFTAPSSISSSLSKSVTPAA